MVRWVAPLRLRAGLVEVKSIFLAGRKASLGGRAPCDQHGSRCTPNLRSRYDDYTPIRQHKSKYYSTSFKPPIAIFFRVVEGSLLCLSTGVRTTDDLQTQRPLPKIHHTATQSGLAALLLVATGSQSIEYYHKYQNEMALFSIFDSQVTTALSTKVKVAELLHKDFATPTSSCFLSKRGKFYAASVLFL